MRIPGELALRDWPRVAGMAAATTVREVHTAAEWNRLVLDLGCASLEQGYEWGEVLRAERWRPYRYAVFAGNACIAAVAVAAWRPLGCPYSILYASRGPLRDQRNRVSWDGLMTAFHDAARRSRAIFLRVTPNVLRDSTSVHDDLVAQEFTPLPDDWTTWNAPRIVLRLDLTGTEEEQLRRVRKTTRQEIRRAVSRGVMVRSSTEHRDLRAFHALLLEMGREKGYPIRGFRRVEALWRQYLLTGHGVLLLADYEGTLVGGLLGVRFGHDAVFQCAAARRDGDAGRLDQGPLLYWEFIRWARAAGVRTIDWGGSGTQFPPQEEDPGYGVYRFKSSFGARLDYLAGYYDLVFRRPLYWAFRRAERSLLPSLWTLRGKLNGLLVPATMDDPSR